MDERNCGCKIIKAKADRKVFKSQLRSFNKIPEEILEDKILIRMCKSLPSNYNFEIPKTVWRIREIKAKRVGLQMPEGLLMFATTITDIIEVMTGADSVIMGDVTYGACCIDDFTAKALNIDLLIHYGHSCLVPIDRTSNVRILYVFVDIKIDHDYFIKTVKHNFSVTKRLALVSTIQYVSTLQSVSEKLKSFGYSVVVPQKKPLSPGEILGCTAPCLNNVDIIIYLGDGRFHLEAIMIANPTIEAYRYDPYQNKLTQEDYNHQLMRKNRMNAVQLAKNKNIYGLILGILGRQGSPKVLEFMQRKIKELSKNSVIVLLPEIFPHILDKMPKIGAWLQIACPRLSIDWGTAFSKPVLTPYEFNIMLQNESPDWTVKEEKPYPMDFYANDSLGPWTPNHKFSEKLYNSK